MARRTRPTTPCGFSLIEAMVAMAVLLVGSLGMVSLHRIGVRMNADGRIMTRATALAQDLVAQMQMWDFVNDPRLANTTTSNDAFDGDFADSTGHFELPVTDTSFAVFDHQESELESQPAPYTWLGTSSASAQGLGFKRYWNVAEVDFDENGVLNARRVAVIVRWEQNGAGRRIVLVTALKNPASTN